MIKNITKTLFGRRSQSIIKIVFVLMTVFSIVKVVYIHKGLYTSHDYWDRYLSLENIYKTSQYVSKEPLGWIPDETINSYAGGAYIQGVPPILIASDTPPLGRYLIGLSALFTGNEHMIILISAVLSLVFLFLIAQQLFGNSLSPYIIVFLVSYEPIFINQLVYTPLLDIIQLMFLLVSMYFYNNALSDKKSELSRYIVACLALGCFIATKFYATGITIAFSWMVLLLLRKQFRKFYKLSLTLPISLFVLLLTYIRVFSLNYSLNEFLGIQKWIFLYHKSQLILPLTIWPLLLFNQWYVWWGDIPILSDPQWRITWPLVTIATLITVLLYITKKIKHQKNIEIYMIWSLSYLLFFTFGQVSSRYLIILLPILYITSFYGIEQILFIKYKIKK